MVFVALVRAINLGKVNRVPMGALRPALVDAGFTDVVRHALPQDVMNYWYVASKA